MSWWILPTTADIGIRAFSSSCEDVIVECARGLQSIQLSDKSPDALNHLTRSTGVWLVALQNKDLERGLVKFLEEVLYRGSIENEWLVDLVVKVDDISISAHVSWVNSELVEREIEIKAITLHELVMREINNKEVIIGLEPNIPTFEGPGWMAQVVLDI
jgi:SHS2 domain-containing protein|tara:strand:- start:1746 stop:2222 length:477 start_codon:yes stop_codon:yes gene_type:complete